jgi:hypothetical protein
MTMKSAVFWDVAPCRSCVLQERIASIFRVEKSASEEPAWADGCRLKQLAHADSTLADFSTLKIEVIYSSETSVHIRSTLRHIPEYGIPHYVCHKIVHRLRSNTVWQISTRNCFRNSNLQPCITKPMLHIPYAVSRILFNFDMRDFDQNLFDISDFQPYLFIRKPDLHTTPYIPKALQILRWNSKWEYSTSTNLHFIIPQCDSKLLSGFSWSIILKSEKINETAYGIWKGNSKSFITYRINNFNMGAFLST